MNYQNRPTHDLHFYIHHACDLLIQVQTNTNCEISRIMQEVAFDLERCNQFGRFCSFSSFKNLLYSELPTLEALIEEGGILDYLEKTYEEKSTNIIYLKGIIGLIAWKIIN